ncbi:MAG TPA: amino acid ABC transporter permease [Thermodesulfobacteriota bacterium]|nr:amino acid ABC transporter permease [Thermodesulfobacteriota bacterium]
MAYQFDFSIIIKYLPLFLKGVFLTVEISFLAILIGLPVGILAALARTSGFRILNLMGAVYVEVFRNTPLLIQIFIIFFGLPGIGIKLSPYISGLTALVLYVGAYNTEVIRAGLEAVPRGQIEAAESLGLTGVQTFLHIILPQTFRISLPALGNNWVALVKNSSLVSVIGMVELTWVTFDLNALTFRSFELFGAATIFYLILIFILINIQAFVEKRYLYKT